MQTDNTFRIDHKDYPVWNGCYEGLMEVRPQSNIRSKRGHWRRVEQAKYVQFIRKYYFIMRSSLLRYHYKIFNTMAEEIGSRNAVQCKSHHQKMLKKFNYSIQKLIFSEEDLKAPIRVGDGLEGNHMESVKKGIENVETNERIPYFIIQAGQKTLIVLDDRFIANY